MPKHYRPPGKKKEGNAAKYITRNKALNFLQLKLPEFRRLCILKGVFPREPKKKLEGNNKTYYHLKDISFLAHEPLLDKSRQIKAFNKKIKKALAKKNKNLASRLENSRPSYTLDHIVRQRYPTFIDALRDLDDALTMMHLFAALPADKAHDIPAERATLLQAENRRLDPIITQIVSQWRHSLRKTEMGEKPRLLILYASQTGNAQDAAERIGREAERRRCHAVVVSMEDFDVRHLPNEALVIFVASTTGQGDTPDSMKGFWKFLLMRSLGQLWLVGMHYAVFGLGDSGYHKFNIVAKKLDKRLSDLGAHPIVERGLGDDQHRSGYEAAFDPWLTLLWTTLKEKFPNIFGEGAVFSDSEMRYLDLPKFQITYHDKTKVKSSDKSFPNGEKDILDEWIECGRARAMVEAANNSNKSVRMTGHGPEPHCFAHMIENTRLTAEDSERDVRHIEFDLGCLGVHYEAGDVLEVMPSQNAVAVDAFIKRCCLDPDAYITVEATNSSKSSRGIDKVSLPNRTPVKLRTVVESTMDIASASPRRYFFEVMSHFVTAEHEKERLQYFASPEGRDDLYQYNQKERRTVIEVLEDFPSVHLPLEWLLQLVPRLQTRMFSISSSPLAHPNHVHITVAVVSWMTPFKRKRHGLCSTWLAQLDPQKDEVHVPVWFHRGALKTPPPSVPLVLVGPGTGCAPFRAFIEERAILSADEPAAPILFFFGCRNKAKDFLYKDFWFSHTKNCKVLSEEKGGGFFVAFSRDQAQKVYVQHKMQEEGIKVWNFLKSGAWVYVAGSATKMPADVMSTLEEVISREGGFSKESASRWLKQLEKVGRYHVEAWS